MRIRQFAVGMAVLSAIWAVWGCQQNGAQGSSSGDSKVYLADEPARASTAPDAYILTPAAPHTPRINGARVFGVRPGHSVLYAIAATGDRPMKFAVDNLPAGVSVDADSGQITGMIGAAGEYAITLHASNSLGDTSKAFKIIVGDEIGLTPSLGWNSWNCWAGSVDQEKVLRSAKAMVASGLSQHGWTFINIDDTWQGRRDGEGHALQGNEKFPDMKGLCDQIHAMGLKAGIYSTPWTQSYANFAGGSSDSEDGSWTKLSGRAGQHAGKFSFAAADAKQWAAWGFDYLKYDWNPNLKPQVQEMGDGLRNSGRDIMYSLSNAAPFATAADYATTANSWRTTGDIRDTWASMSGIGFNQIGWGPHTMPGHFNDPDMLVVGWVGWGPRLHASNLTLDEQYTHISLWSLLSAPMLIGCDLERLDSFTLNLLSNDEVLAVDQDAKCEPAFQQISHGDIRIIVKNLADGSQAIGMFNLGSAPATAVAEIPGKHAIRDLWRQRDLGEHQDEFRAMVPSHGVVLVKASSL